MTTPEGRLKADISAYLDTIPGIFYWRPQGGVYGRPGIPDIVGCLHGRFFGIEAKIHGNTFSGFQKDVKQRIEAAGGICIFAYTVDDVRAVLETI